MSEVYFEPLTPTDYTFLITESPDLHMHVTGLMIMDAGPLKKRGGGIDIDAIKQAYESVLHMIPRYRQNGLLFHPTCSARPTSCNTRTSICSSATSTESTSASSA